jgi:hypothetical protein
MNEERKKIVESLGAGVPSEVIEMLSLWADPSIQGKLHQCPLNGEAAKGHPSGARTWDKRNP